MLEGRYVEHEEDAHVALRRRLLDRDTVLLEPPPQWQVAGIEAIDAAHVRFAAVADLDGPLDDDAFLALGKRFGVAMPETHPSVQRFVERGVILNLVSEHAPTKDVDLQPFATNFLTLHTESSGKPRPEQPRYLVLMCVEPGDESTNAQTVVVPMDAVADRLGDDHLRILEQTHYRRQSPDTPIAHRVGGRHVFTFRDFGADELLWTFDGNGASEENVNDAIRGLLIAMYAPGIAFGVRWRRGRLLVLDNACVFHGRTAGSGAAPNRRRHLKRLRVLAGDASPGR